MKDLWLFKHDAATGALPDAVHLAPGTQCWQSLEGPWTYVYAPDGADLERHATGSGTSRHRLRCLQMLDGASAGQGAPYHYSVETDVLAGHEDDLNAWYAQEHLPGLASVPGTVRAARYLDATGSPRYYACYDLASPDALGSPAWLAVRATAWSARVRPAFRNTRRTMFRRG
jgi:hypothetical protein